VHHHQKLGFQEGPGGSYCIGPKVISYLRFSGEILTSIFYCGINLLRRTNRYCDDPDPFRGFHDVCEKNHFDRFLSV
jgi:hypothetical protein